MYIRARVAAELENDHDMTRVEKIDVAELKNFEKKRKNDVRFYKFIFGKKRLFQAQNLC